MKYRTAASLRQAINNRLESIAIKENVTALRLRRHVAFERLLARLFHGYPSKAPWVLKGGYAMELRFQKARATKDIDLVDEESDVKGIKAFGGQDHQYRELVNAASLDLRDFFSFELKRNPFVRKDLSYISVNRYHVKCYLGKRLFAEFDVDVGSGDVRLWPFEELTSRNLLSFAGVTECPAIPSVSTEQHFAEKVHAYTMPRGDRANTRIKDLVDMVLLVQGKGMNDAKALEALHKTFHLRKTHALPAELTFPPNGWKEKFLKLAKDCELDAGFADSFKLIADYYLLLVSGDDGTTTTDKQQR